MGALKKLKELFDWGKTAWEVISWLGYGTAILGALASIGGAIWAVITGVPLPVAVMAGYCTLVAAVYLGLAPAAYRAVYAARPSHSPSSSPIRKYPNPDYSIWRHVETLTIDQAACLWCEHDPEEPPPDTKITAWRMAFQDAIRRGELAMSPRTGQSKNDFDYERREPPDYARVTRTNLRAWATMKGYDPEFLR